MSQEAALRRMRKSLALVIGPDCSKCPAPFTLTWWLRLICFCLFRPDEGGASVSPVQEEAEPEDSSANQSQGKRSRRHRKRKSDGEHLHWRTTRNSLVGWTRDCFLSHSFWNDAAAALRRSSGLVAKARQPIGSLAQSRCKPIRRQHLTPDARRVSSVTSPGVVLVQSVLKCWSYRAMTYPNVSCSILNTGFRQRFPHFKCRHVLQVYLFLVRVFCL